MTSVSHDNYSTAETYVLPDRRPGVRKPNKPYWARCCWTRTQRCAPPSWWTTPCFTGRPTVGCFARCSALTEQRVVIDHITLRDELLRRELEAAGGLEYLAELVDAVPTAANIEFHSKIVKDKAILRRLIETSTSIITEAYDGHSTANDLLDSAEAKIFQISQQWGHEGFTRIKEMLWPTMAATSKRSSGAAKRLPVCPAVSTYFG